MLVILAILVTIVGFAWPALEYLHSQYRLRQGGQLVQVRLAGARVHAIDTGFVYQFRFEPGGQKFLVLPYDSQALAGQSNAQTRRIPKIAGRLPSPNAQFDSGSTGATSAQPVPGEWLTGISDAGQYAGVNWSAPILFYPDGTATAAQLVIRDKKSQVVTVSIRALTGGVSVSKIQKGGM
jgi:Tfp pilus assembly protein FimT